MDNRTGPTDGPGGSPAEDPKEVPVGTVLEGDTIFHKLVITHA